MTRTSTRKVCSAAAAEVQLSEGHTLSCGCTQLLSAGTSPWSGGRPRAIAGDRLLHHCQRSFQSGPMVPMRKQTHRPCWPLLSRVTRSSRRVDLDRSRCHWRSPRPPSRACCWPWRACRSQRRLEHARCYRGAPPRCRRSVRTRLALALARLGAMGGPLSGAGRWDSFSLPCRGATICRAQK